MTTPEIVRAANEVLTQGIELLLDLDDRSFAKIADATVPTSIGRQYRQMLNHFTSLVQGLRSGEINYRRPGTSARLENEVTFATITTCDMLRALKRCSEEQLARACEVIPVGNSRVQSFTSTIGRELAYCVGSALHQYGIMRALGAEIGLSVPEAFGTTPYAFQYHAIAAAD